MKKTKESTQEYNNYIHTFYFLSQLIDSKENLIQTIIDKIVLSCVYVDFNTLDNILRKHFKASPPERIKGNFQLRREYINNSGDKVSVLYMMKDSCCFRPQLLVTLHQPTGVLIHLLHTIFTELGIEPPVVSKLELAWDFYTDFLMELKRFIEQHLVLKYQRLPSFHYKGTYYTTATRRASKGTKLYTKPVDVPMVDELIEDDISYDCKIMDSQADVFSKKKFLRLELNFNRTALKRMGITFPLTPDQLELNFNRFFAFAKLETEKVRNFVFKKCRSQLHQANKKKVPASAHPMRHKSFELLHRHIDNWCSYVEDPEAPLMETIEFLKTKQSNLKGYSRFLTPIKEMNDLMNRVAHEQGFCM